jgi:hypothetical protein
MLRYAEWAISLREYMANLNERSLLALAVVCLASRRPAS